MRAGPAVRLVLALLALVMLGACGTGPGGPSGPSEEPFGHGTPFVAEDGSTVATTSEDADYDIAFASELRSEPQVPLPDGVERIGPVRRITADGYARSSSSTPFLVGLPVPDGVEPENLAIGFLDRGPVEISLGEGEGTIDGSTMWLFLGAFYDAETKLLLAPFLGVTPEGWEAAVVRSDGFETKTTTSPDDVEPQQLIGVPLRFEATCSWEFTIASESCGQRERSDAADLLEQVFDDLTLLGFTDEPHLQRRPDYVVQISGQRGFWVVPGPWEMELRPESREKNARGMYSPANGSFWAVIGTDGVTARTRRTIRHEYFHATQFGYDPDLTAGYERTRFSIEGQAVLSEDSVPSLARRETLDLRKIDHTLLRSSWDGWSWRDPVDYAEYRTQDFWMFLGQQAGSDLSFLVPFVEEGMAPEDVDAVLKRDWSSTYPRGLEDAYWDWVKNQAFESRRDLGGALSARCTFDARVVDETVELSASNGGSDRETFTLGELTSEVVAFNLTNTASTPASFQLSLELSPGFTTPDLRVKFYDPADARSVECWDAPEVAWQSVLVPAKATVTRHALVANAGLGGFNLNVTASIAPGEPLVELTVSVVGQGSVTSDPGGIDCGTACTAAFEEGATVSLTASPAAGWTFDGWTGDSDCSDGSLTMNGAAACTATFTEVEPTAGADLVVRDLSVTPTAAAAGANVTVAYRVENIGDAPAGPSTVRVRLNDDPTNVTTSDALLAQLATSALAAGQAQAYSRTVSLPSGLADGTHYVWVVADVFNEANQSNYDNDRGVVPIVIGGASDDCRDPEQPISFPDAGLHDAIVDTLELLGWGGSVVDCAAMAWLPLVNAYAYGISDLSGLEYAVNATDIHLAGNRIEDLEPLRSLGRLAILDLDGNEIFDLAPLADLDGLVQVWLSDNRIQDLAGLGSQRELRFLYLNGNDIRDIEELAALDSIEWLDLDHNSISDISPLSSLHTLTGVSLLENSVADIGPLRDLDGLTGLNLMGNDIVDIGPLAGLDRLEVLALGQNRIVNLSPLKNLTALRGLNLRDNRIVDVVPLVLNTGLGQGDQIDLSLNCLDLADGSTASLSINVLEGRGADVIYLPQADCD